MISNIRAIYFNYIFKNQEIYIYNIDANKGPTCSNIPIAAFRFRHTTNKRERVRFLLLLLEPKEEIE